MNDNLSDAVDEVIELVTNKGAISHADRVALTVRLKSQRRRLGKLRCYQARTEAWKRRLFEALGRGCDGRVLDEVKDLQDNMQRLLEASKTALVELEHAAGSECTCDDSVGLRCEACSARDAARGLRRAVSLCEKRERETSDER